MIVETVRAGQELYVQANRRFPEVSFLPDGRLTLRGRLITDELQDFFSILHEWLDAGIPSHIQFDINLEYVITQGGFQLLNLLSRIENSDESDSMEVNWHFEEGDDSIFELGELLQSKLIHAEFRFVEHAEE